MHQSQCSYAEQLIIPVAEQFKQVLQTYTLFNLLFISLGLLEMLLLLFFFTFFVKSALLALSLAIVFFTFFSYFILNLYFQSKKKQQFEAIRDQFVNAYQKALNLNEESSHSYITLANACTRFANHLNRFEYTLYPLPEYAKFLKPYFEKFSIWCHWQDLQSMKELLLQYAVNAHIKLVKCEPTSLDMHAALANAYVTLSNIYTNPRQDDESLEARFLFSKELVKNLKEKFQISVLQAIEEFKILLKLAPHDPWIYSQLAHSYHDLERPLDEINAYESILKLAPADVETLYKLGVLYFQQGMNAQGLGIYEQLKNLERKKADALINHYGSLKI